MIDRTLEETFYIAFTTRAFATGVPTTLAGVPVISAYEDANLVQITSGITVSIDHDAVTGFNMLTIVATAANGFIAGKDYQLIITTGTVDSISVVGEVIGQFSLGLSAAFARLGVPVSASISADIAVVDVNVAAVKVDTGAVLVDTSTTIPAQINALNDVAITDIVSNGAITTLTGAVVNVDTVDVTTTNADMRGTDGANTIVPDNTSITAILADTADMQPKLGAPATNISADIAAVKVDTNALATDWADGGRLDLLIDQLITQIDTPVGEPGQLAPPVSAKMGLKVDYIYKFLRNRSTSTASVISIYADDAATVDHKATHADDGTTYDRQEFTAGP